MRLNQTIGRLAPSPTGYLHLGNAWAFLCAWLGARSAGGRLILRVEDIDPQRSRTELALTLMEDLRWLGLDWDEGPYYQSERLAGYAAALENLRERGLVYPCFCTRKELRSLAGAPQQGDGLAGEGVYPGICRNLSEAERRERLGSGRNFSWRLRVCSDGAAGGGSLPPEFLRIDDLVMGRVSFSTGQAGGDFALCRSDGVFAYQLAVVLDDIAMGVNQIVRGADILYSTPRQLYLYSLLGAVPPAYAHIPLLLDHEGERLAKRHASISLRALRAAGVRPQAVVGWLAAWSGLADTGGRFRPLAANELLPGFSFAKIRKAPGQLPSNIVEVLSGSF